MSDHKFKIIHDLSKEYAFRRFDFTNESPEELLKDYQEASDRISKILDEQETKASEATLEAMDIL